MSYSLASTDMTLLAMANRKGYVIGGIVPDTSCVMRLAAEGFLECVKGSLVGAASNQYALTEKGRDALAIHILSETCPSREFIVGRL